MSNAPATLQPDTLDALWVSIQYGVQNNLSIKQAYRQFAMGQDPSETEEEFETRWQAEGIPLLRQMRAEEDRWLAMTDADRESAMNATATRHGAELTPELKELTLEIRKGRAGLLRNV